MSEMEEKDCDELNDENERNICKLNKFFGFRRGAFGEDVMLEILTPFFQKNHYQVSKLSRNYVAEDGKHAGNFIEFVGRKPDTEKLIEADIVVTNDKKNAILKHCEKGYHTRENVDKVVIIPVTEFTQEQLNGMVSKCNKLADVTEKNSPYRIIRYDNIEELNKIVDCKKDSCSLTIPERSKKILTRLLGIEDNINLKELEDYYNEWSEES